MASKSNPNSNFDVLVNYRTNVDTVFSLIESNLDILKQMYSDTVVSNRDAMFAFGLDSFHFQSKLLDIEFGDLKRQHLLINNRMYCEYYKLFRLISGYVIDSVPEKRLHHTIKSVAFPIYKDLEPYRVYAFDLVKEIHSVIISLLDGIQDHIDDKTRELEAHQRRQQIGLNINNFVLTFDYSVRLVKERLRLYESYLAFFHDLHLKRLQHFSDKLNLLYRRMNTDVHFDETRHIIDERNSDHGDYGTNGDNDDNYGSNGDKDKDVRNMKEVFRSNVKKMMNGLRFLKKKDVNQPLTEESAIVQEDNNSLIGKMTTSDASANFPSHIVSFETQRDNPTNITYEIQNDDYSSNFELNESESNESEIENILCGIQKEDTVNESDISVSFIAASQFEEPVLGYDAVYGSDEKNDD